MTTTDNRPTFPVKITKVRDAPESCPAWCDPISHTEQYAADFGWMETAEQYAEALALFQEHRLYLPELPTTLTLQHAADDKPVRVGGFDMEVMVSSGPSLWFPLVNVALMGAEPEARVLAALTSGEARSYAAQLIAAADAIDLGRTV